MIFDFIKTDPDELPFEALSFLSQALKRTPGNESTLSEVIDMVRMREAEIYIVKKDAILGSFVFESYPQVLNIFLLGGENISLWRDQFAQFVRNYMKKNDIHYLSVLGRQGWSTIFKDLKPIGTFYSFEQD